MSITVNLGYKGTDGAAKRFAEELLKKYEMRQEISGMSTISHSMTLRQSF